MHLGFTNVGSDMQRFVVTTFIWNTLYVLNIIPKNKVKNMQKHGNYGSRA